MSSVETLLSLEQGDIITKLDSSIGSYTYLKIQNITEDENGTLEYDVNDDVTLIMIEDEQGDYPSVKITDDGTNQIGFVSTVRVEGE